MARDGPNVVDENDDESLIKHWLLLFALFLSNNLYTLIHTQNSLLSPAPSLTPQHSNEPITIIKWLWRRGKKITQVSHQELSYFFGNLLSSPLKYSIIHDPIQSPILPNLTFANAFYMLYKY